MRGSGFARRDSALVAMRPHATPSSGRAMRSRRSILVALTALLATCGSCGSNADAVVSARSLSQPRLAQLFRDLQSLGTASVQHRVHFDAGTGIPDAFRDLAPRSITIDGHTARVHLSGCADDKVLLIAKGLDKHGREQITLLPGEAKDTLVLWRSEYRLMDLSAES